jgi:hypothetical protein
MQPRWCPAYPTLKKGGYSGCESKEQWMVVFLRGKGQILWDVTVDTGYVQAMNFLTPGSRDMFDANKVVDYLFRALC